MNFDPSLSDKFKSIFRKYVKLAKSFLIRMQENWCNTSCNRVVRAVFFNNGKTGCFKNSHFAFFPLNLLLVLVYFSKTMWQKAKNAVLSIVLLLYGAHCLGYSVHQVSPVRSVSNKNYFSSIRLFRASASFCYGELTTQFSLCESLLVLE